MKEPPPIPSLEEFLTCCHAECEFLVRVYGLQLLDSPREYNAFSVRYRKGVIGVDIYGENWGQNASCSLIRGQDEVDLFFLVPAEGPPLKKRKRIQLGQLEQVRALADSMKRHASDFLTGDFTRFDTAIAEWRRMTRPRQLTEEERLARQLQQAVSMAGHALKRGDHAEVVRLMEPHENELSPHQRQMLETARRKIAEP